MQDIVYETSFSVGRRGKTKLAPMFFLTIEFQIGQPKVTGLNSNRRTKIYTTACSVLNVMIFS